jgi:hypothetical protein
MPFDRGRAEEQLRADLWVRQAIPSEPRELGFLCGEVIASLDIAFPHGRAGGQQLPEGTLRETRCTHACSGLRRPVGPLPRRPTSRVEQPPAMCFLDLVGYTRLTEEQGDDAAAEIAASAAP